MIDKLQLTDHPLLRPLPGALRRLAETPEPAATESAAGNALQGFGGMLKEEMHRLNDLETQANQAKQTYASGGEIELHQVVLAAEKADLSLQLAMQVRNKIVAAYQEISHMSV